MQLAHRTRRFIRALAVKPYVVSHGNRPYSTMRQSDLWDYIFTTAHRINVITDPSEKTKQSRAAFRKLEELQMPNIPDWTPTEASPEVKGLISIEEPGRPSTPVLCPPWKMPDHKKMGVTLPVYLLHAVAHIELNAIDMVWDTIVRFRDIGMPYKFYYDWVSIAADEARHFDLLSERLHSFNSYYGALPAHEALWKSAEMTKNSLLERIAIIQLVEEARGLDSHHRLVDKFRSSRDPKSAELMDLICREEVRHVERGVFWFEALCKKENLDPVSTFHGIAKRLTQSLLPPFNIDARRAAGLREAYYVPIQTVRGIRRPEAVSSERLAKGAKMTQQYTMQRVMSKLPTKEASMVVTRNLIRMAVGTICMAHELFPESAFLDTTFGSLQTKIITAQHESSAKVSKWLENGAFDALTKGYLENLYFGIYDDPDKSSSLLESYIFNIKYEEDGVMLKIHTNNYAPTAAEVRVLEKTVSRAAIEEQGRLLLKALDTLLRNSPLPSDRELWGFNTPRLYDEESLPTAFKVGGMNTPFHQLSLRVYQREDIRRADLQSMLDQHRWHPQVNDSLADSMNNSLVSAPASVEQSAEENSQLPDSQSSADSMSIDTPLPQPDRARKVPPVPMSPPRPLVSYQKNRSQSTNRPAIAPTNARTTNASANSSGTDAFAVPSERAKKRVLLTSQGPLKFPGKRARPNNESEAEDDEEHSSQESAAAADEEGRLKTLLAFQQILQYAEDKEYVTSAAIEKLVRMSPHYIKQFLAKLHEKGCFDVGAGKKGRKVNRNRVNAVLKQVNVQLSRFSNKRSKTTEE